MDFALFAAAFLFFWAGHPASALLLRCGLSASMRFSPRAALALSSVAALGGAAAGLAQRGGLRAVPGTQRMPAAVAALVGGTLARSALLMLTARFPDSLTLLRLQMLPLLALAVLSLIPLRRPIPLTRMRLLGFSLLCGAVDGFFGAGGMPLFTLTALGGVQRRQDTPTCALLMTFCAQGGALLLTLLTGAAQVFPVRMLALLALGAASGALLSETQKERGALHNGLRIALKAYLILAALSCLEQGLRAE